MSKGKVVAVVSVSRLVFTGNKKELLGLVKSGAKGDMESLCSLFPDHGFCHKKRAFIPHALTPFNTTPLKMNDAVLICGEECGYTCCSVT